VTKKPVLKCEALVVHCMDYRLQKNLDHWISTRYGAGNYDRISLAGSVHDYEMVLKYVQLAVKVHSIQKVALVNHEDCRAYGSEGTFHRHTTDLREAERKIEALFPGLTVETYYMHLDGTFQPISQTKHT
jgi:carbonic anhydrase